MKAEVSLPIEGMPYASVRYFIELDDSVNPAEHHISITNSIKNQPKEASTQNLLEVDVMRNMLETNTEHGEMKSKLIEALKKEIGDKRYEEIKNETINSADFKAITKYSNVSPHKAIGD